MVGQEDLALFQQSVDQGSLAMVDVSYDGQVTDIAVLIVSQIYYLKYYHRAFLEWISACYSVTTHRNVRSVILMGPPIETRTDSQQREPCE